MKKLAFFGCYIVPGKYYGFIEPSRNHIVTTNTNLFTIYYSKDLPRAFVVQSYRDIRFDQHNRNEYPTNANHRSDLKKGAGLINIDTHDNYASDKNDKIL